MCMFNIDLSCQNVFKKKIDDFLYDMHITKGSSSKDKNPSSVKSMYLVLYHQNFNFGHSST